MSRAAKKNAIARTRIQDVSNIGRAVNVNGMNASATRCSDKWKQRMANHVPPSATHRYARALGNTRGYYWRGTLIVQRGWVTEIACRARGRIRGCHRRAS